MIGSGWVNSWKEKGDGDQGGAGGREGSTYP